MLLNDARFSFLYSTCITACTDARTCRTVISYVYCIKGLGILALNYCQEMKEIRPKSMHHSCVRCAILLKFAAAMKLRPCYTPTDDLFPLRFSSSVQCARKIRGSGLAALLSQAHVISLSSRLRVSSREHTVSPSR